MIFLPSVGWNVLRDLRNLLHCDRYIHDPVDVVPRIDDMPVLQNEIVLLAEKNGRSGKRR